jgi:hypothetical protein
MVRAEASRLLPTALLAAAFVLTPAVARASTVSGPHETVQLTTTTKRPNANAGFGYAASYHGTLRRLVIVLPRGTRADTSVPGQCTASDMEIMLVGESACPASAQVGTGQVTVEQFGLGQATYNSVLYNAPGQQLELVESGQRVISVVHTYVHGTTLDGPVPTCVTGGDPPTGCPFDQVTLVSNHLSMRAIRVAHRNYGTTPPRCPRSRLWTGHLRFYYADGSVDRLTYQIRCRPRTAHAGRPSRHR